MSQVYKYHSFVAEVPATVTSACFVSRLGASYGADCGPEEVGNRETVIVKKNRAGSIQRFGRLFVRRLQRLQERRAETDAYDMVLGDVAFRDLADSVWESLQSQQSV